MKSVPISDTTLQVWDRGSGPALLMVHGFPLDHSLWDHQLAQLSDAYRVVAPDLRGFGASGGAGELLTMERLADDLAELLAGLRIQQPVVFCGLSMGGYVAWQFFQRHRQRLAALILCDTRAAADSPQVASGRLYLAERVLAEGTRGTSQEMLQKLFAQQSLQAQPETVERVLRVMTNTAPQTVAAALRGMAQRPDLSGILPRIDCPALALCGEQDQLTPPAEMAEMARHIPAASFRVIPAAGHLAPLENPAAVNLAIREFLQGLTPSV
jgi:pimeloyl-ACP methyl ester carboxylesterase